MIYSTPTQIFKLNYQHKLGGIIYFFAFLIILIENTFALGTLYNGFYRQSFFFRKLKLHCSWSSCENKLLTSTTHIWMICSSLTFATFLTGCPTKCVWFKKVDFIYYIFQILYLTLFWLDSRTLHILFLLPVTFPSNPSPRNLYLLTWFQV